MAGINKVIILGNLGKDPELRHTSSGTPFCSLVIATSETYTDKQSNEKREVTEWHNVVLWRRLAEVANQYLTKGSKVYIEGKLRTRSWEDDNGQKRYATDIQGDVMQMLDRPSDQGNRHETQNSGQSQAAATPVSASSGESGESGGEDDLPF